MVINYYFILGKVSRESMKVSVETAEKTDMFVQSEDGGVEKVKVEEEERVKGRSLSDEQAKTIAQLMIKLEEKMETPQDFEWGIEKGTSMIIVLLK